MSGRLFQNICTPIDATIAPLVQQAIINEIHDIYPDLVTIPIGSVGKKNDFNSDIDIAIITKDIHHLTEIISSVFNYTDSITVESLYIVSISYPYMIKGEVKYVQCDFMNVINEEYTKFRYYCPNYINKESRYKVGQKIMFANMIINHCIDKRHNELPNECFGKYRFEPTGLYRRIINSINKTYTDEFVTTDPLVIAYMCFKDGNTSHFNSIETLWEAIHSDNYRYPNEVKSIERNFFVNCWRKGWENIVPEDFELQYWSNEEIWVEINKQKQINKLNNMFNLIADMENK